MWWLKSRTTGREYTATADTSVGEPSRKLTGGMEIGPTRSQTTEAGPGRERIGHRGESKEAKGGAEGERSSSTEEVRGPSQALSDSAHGWGHSSESRSSHARHQSSVSS